MARAKWTKATRAAIALTACSAADRSCPGLTVSHRRAWTSALGLARAVTLRLGKGSAWNVCATTEPCRTDDTGEDRNVGETELAPHPARRMASP